MGLHRQIRRLRLVSAPFLALTITLSSYGVASSELETPEIY